MFPCPVGASSMDYLSEDLLRKSFACDWLDLAEAQQQDRRIAIVRELRRAGLPCCAVVWIAVSAETSGASDATRSCDALSDMVESTGASSLVTSQSSDRALADCEFVAFDLETTGLHPLWARILRSVPFDFARMAPNWAVIRTRESRLGSRKRHSASTASPTTWSLTNQR